MTLLQSRFDVGEHVYYNFNKWVVSEIHLTNGNDNLAYREPEFMYKIERWGGDGIKTDPSYNRLLGIGHYTMQVSEDLLFSKDEIEQWSNTRLKDMLNE